VVAAADRDRAGLDRAIATQERADADEEREILQRDQLTGVLQRSVGLMALERELSRSSRFGTPLVVVFIDVDGLKRVNDQHGHDRGDEILRSLGDGLLSGMRPYDFAFRYGGDELVCVLPGLFAAQAEARFRVLQAKLASGTIPVPITFGIAERRPGESAEDLLRRADAELYDTWGRTSEHESLTVDPIGTETRAIAAHSLLNSAAVVSMGIETLQENWDRIPRTARLHMLERMLVHSGGIEASLKEMTQGREIAAGLLG
jgi:diguanylate cyclase (GGDEF)-like protein